MSIILFPEIFLDLNTVFAVQARKRCASAHHRPAVANHRMPGDEIAIA
jgi:hypothetical protein